MIASVNLVPVGRHAVLVEVGSASAAVSLATWARDRVLASDIVPGAETVLFDGLTDTESLARSLADWRLQAVEPGPLVELRVTYDGPDLEDVATCWGCDPDQVATRHRGTEFVAAFCGFAPGFAYLSGLEVEVPRLASPRPRVPSGSVALAGRWCGVYPTESPGGWRVIGRTDASLWDVRSNPPALLAPGTRVRFVGS